MVKPKLVKVRRLFYDCEVSHNVVLAFRAGYDQLIRPESILMERKIICICFKFEGEKKVTTLTWDKNQDDRSMLTKFVAVAATADELVAHNGDRYDGPFVRTRCLFHKLPPLPPWKTCDTLQWARKYFSFNSNKLDYIAKFLGHGGKKKMELDDWKDILMKNCRKKLKKMAAYCVVDVKELEKVYHDLKFCVKPKSHAGVMNGLDKWTCPRDGSTNVRKNLTRTSSAGTVSHQMQCQDCGGYFTINDSAFRQYQEFKRKNKGGRH